MMPRTDTTSQTPCVPNVVNLQKISVSLPDCIPGESHTWPQSISGKPRDRSLLG
jgi:hypothetical protein